MSEKQKKQVRIIFALCLIIFVLAVVASFIILSGKKEGKVAVIYQDGAIIERIDLDSVTEPYQIRVDGRDGCYNIIDVRIGKIGITEASCPDKICVNMGYISNSILPVTCLPNRIIIKIEDSKSDITDVIVY